MISQVTNQAVQDLLGFYDFLFNPINHHYYFISQLKYPKFCVITHDLSLKTFNLSA
jgi:hypothetical protein